VWEGVSLFNRLWSAPYRHVGDGAMRDSVALFSRDCYKSAVMANKSDLKVVRRGARTEMIDDHVQVMTIFTLQASNPEVLESAEFKSDPVKWLEEALRLNGHKVNGVRASAEEVTAGLRPVVDAPAGWYHIEFDTANPGNACHYEYISH